MPNYRDPSKISEWHSVGREVALVRQLIGAGVTSLGRANYADKFGEYYTAFFGLSVGFERLSKLVIVADYAICHNGELPRQRHISSFGHQLNKLIACVSNISSKHTLALRYGRPTEPISWKIVECLDSFADAKKGRYANFAALGDPNFGQDEPVSKWWSSVAETILHTHYYGKQTERNVESDAKRVQMMLKDSMTSYVTEIGDLLSDTYSASVHTGKTNYVQSYSRFYTLLVARWLSNVFNAIATVATYTHDCKAFSDAWEPLQTYTIKDRLLRTRKIWPMQ